MLVQFTECMLALYMGTRRASMPVGNMCRQDDVVAFKASGLMATPQMWSQGTLRAGLNLLRIARQLALIGGFLAPVSGLQALLGRTYRTTRYDLPGTFVGITEDSYTATWVESAFRASTTDGVGIEWQRICPQGVRHWWSGVHRCAHTSTAIVSCHRTQISPAHGTHAVGAFLTMPSAAELTVCSQALPFGRLSLEHSCMRAHKHHWATAGSHTVLSLLEHNCEVTIIDNLDNAFEVVFERMKKLAGDKAKNMKFIKVIF